jgi:phage tail-like protein
MSEKYPLPKFAFSVDFGGTKVSFTEVTGLVIERDKIEYREGNSPDLHKKVMPGLLKMAPLVLKNGKFANDVELNMWFDEVSDDRANKRRDVIIQLLDEKQKPVAAWKASRCFPVKVTAPDLKSDANEIAIESIELAHEGLTHIDVG